MGLDEHLEPRQIPVLLLFEGLDFLTELHRRAADVPDGLLRLDLGFLHDELGFPAGVVLGFDRDALRGEKRVAERLLHVAILLDLVIELEQAFTQRLVVADHRFVLVGDRREERMDLVAVQPAHGLLEFLLSDVERRQTHDSSSRN